MICLFFRPIYALIIPTPLLTVTEYLHDIFVSYSGLLQIPSKIAILKVIYVSGHQNQTPGTYGHYTAAKLSHVILDPHMITLLVYVSIYLVILQITNIN